MASKTTDDQSEAYDRVDASDRVVGSVTRKDAHSKRVFHRAVHAWLFDSRGRIFLQQRSATKDTNPLKWGSSMGGHVGLGESYEAAAVREIGEELGLRIGLADLVFVRKFAPSAVTNWEFVKLYFVSYKARRMGKVRVNRMESKAGRFEGVEAVWKLVRSRRSSFTPDFAEFFGWAKGAGVLPAAVLGNKARGPVS